MFLEFILIFLTISINESFSFVKFDQQTTNRSKVINYHARIPIRCGLECLLQCSIGNQNPNYGCLDNCLFHCQWEKSAKKDPNVISFQTDKMDHLSQLKNVTMEVLCSIPCDDEEQVTKKMICDLCKDVSGEDKILTLGEVCTIESCHRFPKFCNFCNVVNNQEPLGPSSFSESLLDGSKETSIAIEG